MKKVRCPSCRSWADWENNPFRPFCDEKCKFRDLGKWATEKYRIPGLPSEDESPDAQKKTDPESDPDEG